MGAFLAFYEELHRVRERLSSREVRLTWVLSMNAFRAVVSEQRLNDYLSLCLRYQFMRGMTNRQDIIPID